MRAARYHGVRDIRIEELPDPTPQSGEVLVKVAHNGICGSDLHEYYSAPTFIPVQPRPLTGVSVPVVLGHEFSGTVVEVGDGVDPGLAGTHERPFDFNPTSLLTQEAGVVGSLVYSDDDYDTTIANMAAGHYETKGWVEHLPLDDLLTGFDDLRAGRKMKIHVDL